MIGVQFTERDDKGQFKHTNIELYVVRDITLMQLMDGVKYGLSKLANPDNIHSDVYKNCVSVFSRCISNTFKSNGRTYFKNITFNSLNAAAATKTHSVEDRFVFSTDDAGRPLCDLGFITSSQLIFDETGEFSPRGILDTRNVIAAFDPCRSEKIFFPEYNISTRQLYQFDTEAVSIISPTEPPRKPNHSLLSMLLPSMISLGMMLLIRIILTSSSGSGGMAMILLSVAMGISAIVTTSLAWKRQKQNYVANLNAWRTHYESYVNSLLLSIKDRQEKDTAKLDTLYPDILTLINEDQHGVYALNEHIYSRAPQDADFLTFRIGLSDDVPNFFAINGENKDVVFSEAFFDITPDNSGNDQLHMFLREELQKDQPHKENLCKLPYTIAQRYAYLKKAPLLYSLKNKGCLGVVDHQAKSEVSFSSYFISRMIFELCYYHSPTDLQFVMFFNGEKNWETMEQAINCYKFMPHFRGLFPDKSQFVFDKDDAHLVMNSLLNIMNSRQEKESGGKSPHIVMVVFDEYGLKEHAFAEYLPKAPECGKEYVNELGLSFVFVAKHKEYLPAYCDDIVQFTDREMTLTPRSNVVLQKTFHYDYWNRAANPTQFFIDYTDKISRASQFFSSVYYAHIAQNGKVPSSVSMFEVINPNKHPLKDVVCNNWGLGTNRTLPSVTKSLRVPVGKTENGMTYLDLHEKADGPHMLVAGTTGSGKTEAIIAYLLGLCMQYRPDELNLLLIDMKGGGFTKRIGHLPHIVGMVTDVDGDENGTGAEYMLGRFLDAMKSEIKRRKLLFNKLRVDSIDGYIRACEDIASHISKKNLSAEDAALVREVARENRLSHLILVVDEFTELKRFSSENGDIDFMGEITTIARVGRSLGFHIILISQNIEGAITDDIRANSNARLCLKVATRQASKEMIGTELAASAYMPGNGRAYLLAGTGSKFEYFQSAYSGADMEERIPVEISLASKTGPYITFYRSDEDNLTLRNLAEVKKLAGAEKSQLEVICETILSVYKAHKEHLPAPHTVFSSPLSSCIAWDPNDKTVVDLNKRKQVKE